MSWPNSMLDIGPYYIFNLVNREAFQCQEDKFQIVPGKEQRPRSESFQSVSSQRHKLSASDMAFIDKIIDDNSTNSFVYCNIAQPSHSQNWVHQSSKEAFQCQDGKLQEVVSYEEQRSRSESISSVSSSINDKSSAYNNMALETFSTVRMDSGSTCISSDHTYINIAQPNVLKDLNREVPGTRNTNDTISSISSASSPLNDSNLEYSIQSNFSNISSNSQDSLSQKSVCYKRSLEEDIYMTSSKRSCESQSDSHYFGIRKKNNAASKNCRKTGKEKRKEMESRVVELEKERDDLRNEIQYLELAIAQLKNYIQSIMQPLPK